MSRDAKWYAYWLRLLPASTPDEKMRIIEAADMLERLEAAQPKWISADKPPEDWRMDDEEMTIINYLVVVPGYGVDIGNYFKPANKWFVMGLPANVTHWMPLPEPPEVKRE